MVTIGRDDPARDRRDDAEVGAFFGLVGGALALARAMLWALATRLGRAPLPLGATARVHALHLLLYAACGAVGGLLWSRRHHALVRLALWALLSAPVALTIYALSSGPAWRWPAAMWGKWALVSAGFAVVMWLPDGKRRR